MISERSRIIVEDLEQTLLEFMRRRKVSHHEYRCATDALIAAVKAGEGSLFYDVFLEAAAINIGNAARQGSLDAIEGPFYLPNAPRLSPPYVLPQRADEAGDVLFFCGSVTSSTGEPLAAVELDMWQADAQGRYSNVHPNIPEWNLRGRFYSSNDGTFEIRTILPPPYEIPNGGPTAAVLKILGRHLFRPAHLHLKLSHPQYHTLTSIVYFGGGDYLDSDVANAVRDDLVSKVIPRDDLEDLAARELDKPYFEIRRDFVLVPRTMHTVEQAGLVRLHERVSER